MRYFYQPERNISRDPENTEHIACSVSTADTFAVYFGVPGDAELIEDFASMVEASLYCAERNAKPAKEG